MPNILPRRYEVVQCKHYSSFLRHFSNFVMHFDVVWRHFISNRDVAFGFEALYLRRTTTYGLELRVFFFFFAHRGQRKKSVTLLLPLDSSYYHRLFLPVLAACRWWSISRGRVIWGIFFFQTKNGKSVSSYLTSQPVLYIFFALDL